MSEFYISDYIWYIIGGVALFFVIVGFVADKSGLAKKTFSKDSKKNNNAIQPEPIVPVQQNIVAEPIVMPATPDAPVENVNYENDNESVLQDEAQEPSESLYISDETPIVNDDFLNVESQDMSVDEAVNVLPVDEVVQTSSDENLVSEEDNVWDNPEVTDEVLVDSEIDFDGDADASFTLDNVGETNMDVTSEDTSFTLDNIGEVSADIASEDAEDEWGMDSASDGDVVSSIDTELPNLDDLTENSEEDVWKF